MFNHLFNSHIWAISCWASACIFGLLTWVELTHVPMDYVAFKWPKIALLQQAIAAIFYVIPRETRKKMETRSIFFNSLHASYIYPIDLSEFHVWTQKLGLEKQSVFTEINCKVMGQKTWTREWRVENVGHDSNQPPSLCMLSNKAAAIF